MATQILNEFTFGKSPFLDVVGRCRSHGVPRKVFTRRQGIGDDRTRLPFRMNRQRAHTLLVMGQCTKGSSSDEIPETYGAIMTTGHDLANAEQMKLWIRKQCTCVPVDLPLASSHLPRYWCALSGSGFELWCAYPRPE